MYGSQGVLKGFDQCINVVLDDSFERVFSLKEPVEAVELGLYIVRGDNMYVASVYTILEAHVGWMLMEVMYDAQLGDRRGADGHSRASDRRPDARGATKAAGALDICCCCSLKPSRQLFRIHSSAF